MALSESSRRLAAIVVADVVGFSRLMERDESVTFTRLRQLREEVTEPKIHEYRSRVIKTTGDGFLSEFASPSAALRCASEIQRDVTAGEGKFGNERRIRLRIGINVGDIIVDGDDVAGDGVNIAARLEALAQPDGICVSQTVREQIHDDLGIVLVDLGEQKLKNIRRPIRAFGIALGIGAGASDAPGALDPSRATSPMSASPDTPSIGVLPFANLSRDEENEYFADGLAEELLNVLAKIRGLRVASRTSAFFFKGKDVDLRTVAEKLGVATVLEGSIRRSG